MSHTERFFDEEKDFSGRDNRMPYDKAKDRVLRLGVADVELIDEDSCTLALGFEIRDLDIDGYEDSDAPVKWRTLSTRRRINKVSPGAAGRQRYKLI